MITLDVGKLGSGKSYSATWDVWKMIHKGKDCYVNWKIDFTDYFNYKRKFFWYKLWNPPHNFGKVYYFDGLKDLNLLRNGEVFYDEAHMDIDARDFQKLDPDFKRKLTQSRKYGLNLHFISQHSQQIDVTVRRLANVLVEHKKYWRLFTWREYDGEKIENLANTQLAKPKSQGFGFYWFSKRFAKSYDTFALFKPYEDYKNKPIWDVDEVLKHRSESERQVRSLTMWKKP